MKDKKITAVGVGRYHSAVCTEHEVFTFGKNLGQLGMCLCVLSYRRLISKQKFSQKQNLNFLNFGE